jgi:hypothetical protein
LPHGSRLLADCEVPGNLEHLRNHPVLSEEIKEKILYKNAKRLFNLQMIRHRHVEDYRRFEVRFAGQYSKSRARLTAGAS